MCYFIVLSFIIILGGKCIMTVAFAGDVSFTGVFKTALLSNYDGER